ncbi:tyrosine-type recombinase/integrase [Pseudomonas sp. GX19020]|uniref:tyrosine-type recombinase/integrase n=1 Tax=Pseudomonas sp. GX19020 TaxID=2942277 RepID=UPI0020197AA3|nr:tyrosine-type recombinase/integrase [Pseudomonas sp. GX19020]MCL4069317.1 tyrosine-type recombinase/integrase [Pseudomonas sp. GX19020]
MATRIRLTKAAVERLSLERDGQWIVDAEMAQLVVRLTPTSKTYTARWSGRDGKRKQVTIAPVGSISVDEARNRARKLVSDDTNPTVETLADLFGIWDEAYSTSGGEEHADNIRSAWKNHIGPDLGKKKISRLTHDALQDWYNKKISGTWSSPNGKVQDAPFAAATVNRWIAYLSKFFTIARKRGLMTGNPLEGIEKSTAKRRLDIFTLEDVDTLSDRLTAVQDKYPVGVALIRFLMMVPARGIEARELRWADLNLTAGTWTIPADRYKTDEDKVFGLPPHVVQFLSALPRRSNTYVFPAPKDAGAPVRKEHQRDVWERVRRKPLGAHALRKTIATAMLNKGVPLEAVSKLLGHSSTLVTQQVYAHLAPAVAGKYLEVWHHMLNDDAEDARQKALAASDPGTIQMLEVQKALAVAQANGEEDPAP